MTDLAEQMIDAAAQALSLENDDAWAEMDDYLKRTWRDDARIALIAGLQVLSNLHGDGHFKRAIERTIVDVRISEDAA